jgi:hypothetical protein
MQRASPGGTILSVTKVGKERHEPTVPAGGRHRFPAAAVLMALAFFLSVLSPEATEPNAMIYLAYVGGMVLAVGLLVLAVGLIWGRRTVPAV